MLTPMSPLVHTDYMRDIMEDTLNTVSTTVAPVVELKLYPKRDGTWGWKWHDNDRNVDFGPTFDLMNKAHVWFDTRNESNGSESFSDDESSTEQDDMTEELYYEPEELPISNDSTEKFSDVDFDEEPDDSAGNR